MTPRKTDFLYDAILFSVAAALYFPSLWYGFVGDDLIFFIGNRYIESFDLRKIMLSGAIGFDYLPLRDLSLALDFLIWGKDPFGFHLTNVVLYGLTAVALRHLFLRLNAFLVGPAGEKTNFAVFLAGLAFTLDPTHREVVCAIFNRGALMTTLFCILACIYFLRYLQNGDRGPGSYAFALFFYVCALLSREYGIILPLVLVLLIFFGDRSKRPARLVRTGPFFATAALFFLIYMQYALAAQYIKPATEPLLSAILSKAAVAVKIMLFYMIPMKRFITLFSPAHTVIAAVASAAIIAGVLLWSFMMRRRHPQVLFGFLFYLVCLIPVLNFFKTEPLVAGRYSYLPCLGLFFILTSLQGKKQYASVLVVALTLLWAFFTRIEMGFYKNNIAYWENTLPSVQAGSLNSQMAAHVYTQLGYAYYEGHQYAKALQALRQVRPAPANAGFHIIVGSACYELGDYECAVQSFKTAIASGANDIFITIKLAEAEMAMKMPARGTGPQSRKMPK